MPDTFLLQLTDRFIKPKEWYEFSEPAIRGFQLIASKEDQKCAGQKVKPPQVKVVRHGPNPIKPYRDYFGSFTLHTKLIPDELEVKFAIGYTILSKVVTVDDYSNLGWLRLATGIDDFIYPNLAHQKQLLDFLLSRSKQPAFVVTRVYHYLQNDVRDYLTQEILEREEKPGPDSL